MLFKNYIVINDVLELDSCFFFIISVSFINEGVYFWKICNNLVFCECEYDKMKIIV